MSDVEKPYKEELEEWINWANSIMTLHQVRTGTVAETTLAIRKCQRWISHEIETALPAPCQRCGDSRDGKRPTTGDAMNSNMQTWTAAEHAQIDAISNALSKLYTVAQAIAWFYSPQATLQGQIPAELVRTGKGDQVLNAIQAAVDGNHI